MKILYFHQHFSTPLGSSSTRSYELARALILAGHQVTIVCGSFQLAEIYCPFDKHKDWRRGDVDGIDVISLPLAYSNRDSLPKRTVAFLLFALRSIKIALRQDYDLVFATSTPLTAGLPGVAARWLRGKPFIFEVRDLWPELPRALGMRNPFLLAGMSILEWVTYQSAKACIGLSPGILEGIRRRSQQGKPLIMIPNGCDLNLFKPGPKESSRLPGLCKDDFIAAFTGAVGPANGLDTVLDAASILKKRGNRRVKILIIGDGKEKDRLVSLAKSQGLDNCFFLPPLPKIQLASLVRSFNCGLMVLKNIPAFYYGTSPNKFFDYIAAGIPVLNNYPGWLADIVREHKCGIVVSPDDPEALASTLEQLACNVHECQIMSQNARKLAEEKFSRTLLAARFVSFLEKQFE